MEGREEDLGISLEGQSGQRNEAHGRQRQVTLRGQPGENSVMDFKWKNIYNCHLLQILRIILSENCSLEMKAIDEVLKEVLACQWAIETSFGRLRGNKKWRHENQWKWQL